METEMEEKMKSRHKIIEAKVELSENKPDSFETTELNTLKTIYSDEEHNLESVLSELKIFGRYHFKFLISIGLLVIATSPQSTNYVFAAENVGYRCRYSDCDITQFSRLEENSSIDLKCHKYDLFNNNDTCTEDNFDMSSATECIDWVYDKPKSFVAEFNLGCKDWKRTLVGTMHSIGVTIGMLFIGPLSDKFGRKKLVIFTAMSSGAIGVLKSFSTSYWIFIALEMLEPSIGFCYCAIFTMTIETVTTKRRPMALLMLSIFLGIGGFVSALMAYLTPNWRIYLRSLYAPALLSILYIFWMDESIKWLLTKGRKEEAQEIIRLAAKTNNMTIDESKIANLKCEHNSSTADLTTLVKLTFSSRKLFIRFLICISMWFTSLFNANVLTINSVALEGNKYVNYGLTYLSSAFAGIILLWVLARFKRKGPLILFLSLTGVFCLVQSVIPKGYRWLSILLYLGGSINTCVSLRISYLYTSELFPTYTRTTMLGLCSSLGRTATILSPQTPLLLKYWSGLPSLLVGILSLMTASVVSLLPDTSEDVLPDNVEEAEAVGSRRKEKEECH